MWSVYSQALTGKTSNYDTDVFKPIFAAIQEQVRTRNPLGLVD